MNKKIEIGLPKNYILTNTKKGTSYKILEINSRGGSAFTYIAEKENEKYIIKELFPKYDCELILQRKLIKPNPYKIILSEDSVKNIDSFKEYKADFVKEFNRTKELNYNSYTSKVIDIFNQNNTLYIVMPYEEGITLDKYINTNDFNLSLSEILEIGIKICDSVISIHKSGIIHMDISPDNIIISTDNKIKIIDFGTSKKKGEPISKLFSKDGFSSPEIWENKIESINEMTDIYSILSILYKLISGRVYNSQSKLHSGEFDDEYFNKYLWHLKETEEKVIELKTKKRCMKELNKLFDKGFDPDVGDRFRNIPSAYNLKNELIRINKLHFTKGAIDKDIIKECSKKILIKHLNDNDNIIESILPKIADTSFEGIKVLEAIEKCRSNKNPHLYVIGEGGMGKTTSLFNVWNKYIDTNIVPIFIQLNNIFDIKSYMENYLVYYIISKYLYKDNLTPEQCYKEKPLEGENLIKLLREKNSETIEYILLLDGLNEVNLEDLDLITTVIKNVIKTYKNTQVIITSRVNNYCLQTGKTIYLKGVDEENIAKLLSGKNKELDKSILDLLQNPMYLLMYTSLMDVNIEPKNKGLLISLFIEKIKEGIKNKEKLFLKELNYKYYLIDHVLPFIGNKMERTRKYKFKLEEIDSVIEEILLKQETKDFRYTYPKYKKEIKRQHDIDDILDFFVKEVGILRVSEDEEYCFYHQNYRDYFSSLHIKNEVEIYLNRGETIKDLPASLVGEVLPIDIRKMLADLHPNIEESLNIFRHKFDSVGYGVFNIIETLKIQKNMNLSGLDLSYLDFKYCKLFNVEFSENGETPSSFNGSKFYESNFTKRTLDFTKANNLEFKTDGNNLLLSLNEQKNRLVDYIIDGETGFIKSIDSYDNCDILCYKNKFLYIGHRKYDEEGFEYVIEKIHLNSNTITNRYLYYIKKEELDELEDCIISNDDSFLVISTSCSALVLSLVRDLKEVISYSTKVNNGKAVLSPYSNIILLYNNELHNSYLIIKDYENNIISILKDDHIKKIGSICSVEILNTDKIVISTDTKLYVYSLFENKIKKIYNKNNSTSVISKYKNNYIYRDCNYLYIINDELDDNNIIHEIEKDSNVNENIILNQNNNLIDVVIGDNYYYFNSSYEIIKFNINSNEREILTILNKQETKLAIKILDNHIILQSQNKPYKYLFNTNNHKLTKYEIKINDYLLDVENNNYQYNDINLLKYGEILDVSEDFKFLFLKSKYSENKIIQYNADDRKEEYVYLFVEGLFILGCSFKDIKLESKIEKDKFLRREFLKIIRDYGGHGN